jgi:phospholipase C
MQDQLTAAVTRRQALKKFGAATAGAAALGGGIDDLLARAIAASPRSGSLNDIEHVVIFMQENRSFDHYFGVLSGVRGFDDERGRHAFFQRNAAGHTIHPFHLPTGCLPDLTHDWGPQHRSWNGGRMNGFVRAHEAADPDGVGVETMGYYTGKDLHFYYSLANAFTICDGYHCSVIGPTDPNRLMSMTGTIDPAGRRGGPLVQTIVSPSQRSNRFTWTTMPERLQARGVSWKVYTDPAGGVFDNVLTYFKQYRPGSNLARRGLQPTYPNDFMADVANDRLPRVSWLLSGLVDTEHPGYSKPLAGEAVARQIVETLVSHPRVWRRTALFITWDENGGFFDHVNPPTPPKGTAGEYLTVANLPPAAEGIRGPIGLGFRVPMIVVSPFSRGGLVCSDVLDHTSTLRFLETRFGVEVPNLSAWRRRTTGDLTSAFNFAARPDYGRPRLAQPDGGPAAHCTKFEPVAFTEQPFPRQDPGRRRRPSGIVAPPPPPGRG